MKISLLRIRENFEAVFSQAVSDYFSARYGASVEVTWLNRRGSYVVNDQLNVIYPRRISRSALDSLTREFSWHNKALRRVLQQLYVYFAVRPPFETLLASGGLSISGADQMLSDCVFIPGNHSIRLVDLHRNCCSVFLKPGFDARLLKTDSETRVRFPFLSAPAVSSQDPDGGWYEEERVVGMPLNRLSTSVLREKFLVDAKENLAQLYVQTQESVDLLAYIDQLRQAIVKQLTMIGGMLGSGTCADIIRIVDSLSSHLRKITVDTEVVMVVTHGDFQPANILCSSRLFWLIDWEYSSKRSIFYDALVYTLQARFPDMLARRLQELDCSLIDGRALFTWTGLTLTKRNRWYLQLFVYEDLLLRLQEVAAPGIVDKRSSVHTYLRQLMQFLLVDNGKS